jgi:hypothetical protein
MLNQAKLQLQLEVPRKLPPQGPIAGLPIWNSFPQVMKVWSYW